MNQPLAHQVNALLEAADTAKESYAATVVDDLLRTAAALGASDLHLQPTQHGLELKWRIDGVLHSGGLVPRARAENVLARLKVLAGLLTYRTETPQEGRIGDDAQGLEFRVSTFPTLHGEKAAIRVLVTGQQAYERLDQLGFDAQTEAQLRAAAAATSGAILLVGPAGSGKTTTAYTLLQEIVRSTAGGRSIASLEDPIEAAVDGVAQSQIQPAAGFDLLTALRSLVRQDPEVILVGEIRDAEVAKVTYQAAMTGQLVVTTFHAADAADALTRLLDMGIPPYIVRGATRLVVAQRLMRRSCEQCGGSGKRALDEPEQRVDAALNPADLPRNLHPGCDACRATGYRGRILAAEAMPLESAAVAQAILRRTDADRLRKLFTEAGYASLLERARSLMTQQRTTPEEVVRTFGLTAINEMAHAD